jgi:hypothetical protein
VALTHHLKFWLIPQKPWRMRWVGLAAFIGKMKNAYRILIWKPMGRDHLRP